MHVRRWTPLLAGLTLTLTACASATPPFDTMEADQMYEYGMTELRERDWSDAELAFQRFVLQFPGDPRVAEARYRIGETFMGRKEYVTAAVEFNRLAAEAPNSEWADDARFRVCEAYRELSPKPPLTQEYTISAIDHCNSLLVYYPTSEFAPRAREIIQELTNRLAEKEYLTADYYFRLKNYHSANLSYDRVVAEYPTTMWAPRALLRLYRSYQELKYDTEAAATRERLLRDYPNSPEAKQLGGNAARP